MMLMLSRIRQKELIAKIPVEDRTPQDIDCQRGSEALVHKLPPSTES
jgi:hypothetical protein